LVRARGSFVRLAAPFGRPRRAAGLTNGTIMKPRASFVRATATFGFPRAQFGSTGFALGCRAWTVVDTGLPSG
jgi:hypothetical protein